MPDNAFGVPARMGDPGSRHTAVTPSNTVPLTNRPRALYCLTGGNLALRDDAGTDVTYPVVAGQILPFRAAFVLATGTTAACVGWD